MNRINPLYFLCLFITLFIVSIFITNKEVDIYKENLKEFEFVKTNAYKYSVVNNSWINKVIIEEKINSILNHNRIKKAKILKINNDTNIKIKVESKDSNLLNLFLNKLLNENFFIKRLEIKREYISVEIGSK